MTSRMNAHIIKAVTAVLLLFAAGCSTLTPRGSLRSEFPQDGFSRFHEAELSRGAAESAERENGHSSFLVEKLAPGGDSPCIHGGSPFSANPAARRGFPFFIASRLPSNVLATPVGVS